MVRTAARPCRSPRFAEVRPWARSIKLRTSIRDRMGAMPPFYLEKDLGIQEFKDDPSLSDEELAKIQAWADNGAPRGDPADMPPPREFAKAWTWTIGEPDLVLRSPEMTVPAIGPDRWGDLGLVPTGLTEDRYVKAVEIREVNNIASDTGSSTVGGRWVFHHMTYSAGVLNEEGTGIVDDTGRVGACAGAPVGAQPRPVVRHDAVGEAPKGAVGPVAGRKMVCVVMRASISCGRDYRRPSSPRLKPVRLRQGYGEISPLVR